MTAKATAPPEYTLRLTGITKRFGTTLALDDVSLRVRRGTVHALLGENGAGKTTLMRIAFGLLAADAGRIEIEGVRTAISSPADAIAARIGMVHQHFTSVPTMTVAENVALGGTGMLHIAAAGRVIAQIGARTGLTLDMSARAEDLPVGAQQRLEIVKALARHARTLILDEPTAVLAPIEAKALLRWLRQFAAAGNSVVLITHKLREAIAIADDVTVLRRGRVVLAVGASTLTMSALTTAMLGDDVAAADERVALRTAGPVVGAARHVDLCDGRGATVVRDATFDIHAGEVLGIAAVEGAGHRELLRALAGRTTIALGDLRLPSTIGFVPEDRHRDGLVLEFAAPQNVALRDAGVRRGRIAWNEVRLRTIQLIRAFDVRGGNARSPVRSLSGGNQQKLVLAREIDGAPALLVVENPTRGLDVRAAREVHERLRSASTSGAAVVIYSSDLDEVLALATRILVIHAGVVRETTRDRDAVGRAMLGVA